MRRFAVKLIRAVTFGGADYVRYLWRKIVVTKKVAAILKSGQEIKLEIGAGEKKGKNGWLTLDIGSKSDLSWDLRYGIPFPDGSVSQIYSSHLFEHLSFQHINALLAECRRVLKEHGIFMICVPNARLYIESYFNKDDSFWKSKPAYWKPAFHNTSTRMDWINYVAYMDDEHKYMFDEENLTWLLKAAHFEQVGLREFDGSLDDPARHHESVYAKGVKPARSATA